jgi:hypothetical protein
MISKFLLSVVALLATIEVAVAQSFSNTPNDTVNKAGLMEDLETLSIQQLNTSSDTIILKWEKVSVSIPTSWEASVCDNSICYATLVDSGMMNPVAPRKYGLLLLHITPRIDDGIATIRYAVWDIKNPSLKDTLTYILSVNKLSGVVEPINTYNFSIFPNPAKEYINITSNVLSGFHFSIADAAGKEVAKGFSKTNTHTINMENLANGLYFISFSTKNTLISTQKMIVQK